MTRLRLFRFFIAITCLVCAAGCIRPLMALASFVDRSVKTNESLRGGYELGGMYQLVREASIQKKQPDSSFPILVPTGELTGGGNWDGPKSRTDYAADPDEYPDVFGFVPANTKLKCVDIRERGYRVTGTYIEVVGKICEGEFAGRKVSLADLSEEVSSPEAKAWSDALDAKRKDPKVKLGKPPLVPLKPDTRYIVPSHPVE